MDELILKTFVLGELSNNCYLIFSKKSKKACLIDAPAPISELNDFIKSRSLDIVFIALTHAHFDHIKGLNSESVPFYIHESDIPFLKDPNLNGSIFFGSPVVVEKAPEIYREGMPFCFEDKPIDIIHTPGHTPGSVSLKLGNWLFSGDTLFFGSVGRTDVPLASEEVLISSIREKIMSLPGGTAVLPGHGPSTTVERERKHNPFLKL